MLSLLLTDRFTLAYSISGIKSTVHIYDNSYVTRFTIVHSKTQIKFPLLLIFIYVCFFIIIIILIKTQKQPSFQVKKKKAR